MAMERKWWFCAVEARPVKRAAMRETTGINQAIASHDRDCKAGKNMRVIKIKKEKMVVLRKNNKTEAMFMRRLTRTEM